MSIQKVLVTGAGGRVGSEVVCELRAQGYQVTAADKVASGNWWVKVMDCEDLGQVIGVMRGHDAVIHMAAIPSPLAHAPEVVYRNNVISTYNVLEAADVLGIRNVVLASSVSALGSAFCVQPFTPLSIPIDETHPLLSQDAYGLSKTVGEVVADGFCRRIPDLCLSSLRFAFVIDDQARENYLKLPENRERLGEMLANVLWVYVDVRDTALSCRLAMERAQPGHEAFFINAPTTLVDEPVEELLARYYPGEYPVNPAIRGQASPIDCSKAERLLGWKARYDWLGNPL